MSPKGDIYLIDLKWFNFSLIILLQISDTMCKKQTNS